VKLKSPAADIAKLVYDVPDFPKKGIVFKDITPLLADAEGFKTTIDWLCEPFSPGDVRAVAGVESRGFLLATAMAYKLGAGVVLIRKKGKLPRRTISATYALEYGTDSVEAHEDAVVPGTGVLLVDDVLATGGTAAAAEKLLEKLGAKILGARFLIELEFLKGRKKLGSYDTRSLLKY